MIIEYTLTKEDLFNFNFYVGWTSPEKKSYKIKYYLKSILWPLAAVLFILSTTNKNLTTDTLLTCISFGLLVGFIGAYIGIYSIYKRKIEKFINDPNNINFFARTELILSDCGITSKDEYSEIRYGWNAIIKKNETQEYIYLFLSSIQGIVIPKKVLTAKEKNQLVDLLNRNITLTAEFNKEYSAFI